MTEPSMRECVREGLTPDIDGDTDTLIVGCSVHGEIGRIPSGGDEFGAAEELFAAHRKAVGSVISITCPTCGRTSYSPADIEQGYCGNCHDWTQRSMARGIEDARAGRISKRTWAAHHED